MVMRWNGGGKSTQPLAFVGKGVTFDTGGISIKPADGMEEMKWDMGGAGVVIGLMKALAGAKPKSMWSAWRAGREYARRQCAAPRRRGEILCRARPSKCSTPTPKAAWC